jgi:hypothetical protein
MLGSLIECVSNRSIDKCAKARETNETKWPPGEIPLPRLPTRLSRNRGFTEIAKEARLPGISIVKRRKHGSRQISNRFELFN